MDIATDPVQYRRKLTWLDPASVTSMRSWASPAAALVALLLLTLVNRYVSALVAEAAATTAAQAVQRFIVSLPDPRLSRHAFDALCGQLARKRGLHSLISTNCAPGCSGRSRERPNRREILLLLPPWRSTV